MNRNGIHFSVLNKLDLSILFIWRCRLLDQNWIPFAKVPDCVRILKLVTNWTSKFEGFLVVWVLNSVSGRILVAMYF